MSVTIDLAGEKIALLPERGLFWGRDSLLLVADWHIGKAAAFRAAGIGVPDGDLEEEFARLDLMLEQTGAGELLVLGDFVHAQDGLTADLIERVSVWIAGTGVRVALVSGNHDRSAGIDRVARIGIEMLGDGVKRGPFVLRHEPGESADGYVLAGHIHPAVRLGEGKVGGLRAPCFWFGERCGVLPAFGGFTGGKRVAVRPGDQVFAVGGGEVLAVGD